MFVVNAYFAHLPVFPAAFQFIVRPHACANVARVNGAYLCECLALWLHTYKLYQTRNSVRGCLDEPGLPGRDVSRA